jgi:hypothetical protein
MLFKSMLGLEYELAVPLDKTFEEITVLINEKYTSNFKITYVHAGHTVKLTDSPVDEGLTNSDTVYIVTVEAPPREEQELPRPAVPAPPLPEEPAYEATYNGDQIRTAMQRSSDVLMNLIHMIGTKNPFFLSYLAVNPKKAADHIEETLVQPDFVFKVHGDSVSDDPIKPYLMHPSGTNGHLVDQSNLVYILEQCRDFVETEESMAHARQMYLLMDRDIRKTIDVLQNPRDSVAVSEVTADV